MKPMIDIVRSGEMEKENNRNNDNEERWRESLPLCIPKGLQLRASNATAEGDETLHIYIYIQMMWMESWYFLIFLFFSLIENDADGKLIAKGLIN